MAQNLFCKEQVIVSKEYLDNYNRIFKKAYKDTAQEDKACPNQNLEVLEGTIPDKGDKE